jgi:uncharacterized membrane protein
MEKNTFAIVGIFSLLLLSFTFIGAAYTTENNNVTLTTYVNALTDVSPGETYDFDATVENLNSTDFYVVFGTTNWDWDGDGTIILSGNSKNFTGELTIPTSMPGSKSIIAKFYDATNNSEFLFQLSKSISLSYINDTEDPILGCTDSEANNYDPDATEDDGSCTYTHTDDFNFCEINGKVGDLKISDVTFTNFGEGEDEDWFLLDEIEIEVEVENTHNANNIRDVLVEIMILDDQGNDATKDFELDDEEIDLNTIKDDDSEVATFRIKEVPADLESGDYKVYIKAYSEDAEAEQCVAEAATKYLDQTFYQPIDVTREDDPAVIIKQTIIPTISASCGDESIIFPANVYNLGSDKEDKVLVTLTNSELGIDERIVIDNLKSGKRKEVTFFFDLPNELSRDLYVLDLKTYYDYDEDEDELSISSYSESSFNDLDKNFKVRLEILSCQGPIPTIDADLTSEATLGKELTIKAIVTNNGDDNNFIISVANFESWTELVSITPQTATINEGESVEVIIKFIPTEEGIQSFKVNAIVDGETYEQPISVNIKEKPSLFAGASNGLLYTIAAIAAILIIIFLILIIKISRRQAKPQF